MFYKEDYSFELGTFAAHSDIIRHIRSAAIEQFDRFSAACNARNIPLDSALVIQMEDLSYMWALNLEIGVETLAIYRKGVDIPIVVVDQKTIWCGEPHHQHMAEFVNHHMGKSAKNRRNHGAEFVLKQLNLISIGQMEDDIRAMKNWDYTTSVRRALLTIDVETVAV